jgi:hypothetical protein
VYDGDSTFALNDVIEVVGFLSVTPTLCVFSDEMEEDEETCLHSQPASLVPRLHAVNVRKLQHNNPLWHPTVCSSGIYLHNFYFMHSLRRLFKLNILV